MMLAPHELARIFFAGELDEARIVFADAFDGCEFLGAASIAIGVFDGVHRGHQELIDAVIRDAHDHGSKAVVITFDPDPDVVVSPLPAQKLMTTADRLHALAQTGVDAV
ncbi:riboflavin biosynthesis protein RibF, partial [Collinsella aerofaciens]|nr:riboflavin biosynthesis protein RibF [Collinsella aerofaciens]